MSLSLPLLHPRFAERDRYRSRSGSAYTLLPMRFLRLDEDPDDGNPRYVVSNFAGDYVVVRRELLNRLIRHELEIGSPDYDNLKAKHFLLDHDSTVALDLLAAKYRTRKGFLSNFTSLFLFVTTLRCEHSCPYCQVSRQSEDRNAYDMTPAMADAAIEFMFCSPSPTIKVEFQGGEPLLNFDLIRHVVERVKARNASESRNVQFVIATNLALLSDEVLQFCGDHEIYLSTSLDGPRELHNRNRPRPGRDSYERTIDGIRRIRASLGADRVAALMTTTEASLSQPIEIVDEYVRQGFSSIFLRSISPYGFAIKTGAADRYQTEQWLEFYKAALAHIIRLNQNGTTLREEYSAILLRKMLTPFTTGYVDLQSPAGMGISVCVFNYDGDIYAADEARMLAEMGDRTFRLGNVLRDSFADVMSSDALLQPLADSMAESSPMCDECGVQPFCGSDPVFHHATQGDWVGHKPTSAFCRKNMEVIRHLIRIMEDDPEAARILRRWAYDN